VERRLPSGSEIRDRYDRLIRRLRHVAEAAGRDPEGFRVVAVTKGWPVEVVRAAMSAGLGRFGESRVQEAQPKVAALPDVEWHLVGRLQSNKARRAAQLFATVHSVDSLDLLARLDRVAHEEGRRPSVLLQVNLTGQAGSIGFDEGWFAESSSRDGELVQGIGELTAARVDGLMTMARLDDSDSGARARFGRLRELRDALAERLGRPLPELSMGMSSDAEAGIAEGATLVRIGTALFGPRHP
jgi:PLP dependent protein